MSSLPTGRLPSDALDPLSHSVFGVSTPGGKLPEADQFVLTWACSRPHDGAPVARPAVSSERTVTAASGLFVDGRWRVRELTGWTVTNPATGEPVGAVVAATAEQARAAVAAAHAAFPAWSALSPDERGRAAAARLRAGGRAGGRAGARAHAGGRQAARRGRGRGALGRRVPALVRGGDPPPVGRDPGLQRAGSAPLRAPPPARRRGLHHAVELPERDDHAQARAGGGRGQHGRAQAGRADAAVGRAAVRDLRTRPASRPACSTSCAAIPSRSARSSRARRRSASSPSRARARSGGCSPPAAPSRASTRAWSWAGTRRSSSSPTPTSTWPPRS